MSSKLIRKVVRLGASGGAGIRALIFATGWVFVFGAVFMLGNAYWENENTYENFYDVDDEDGGDDVKTDYIAHRNMYNAMCGNLNFSRHGEGISAEDMEALEQSTGIASVKGVIGLPGLKLLYPEDAPLSESEKALELLNIDHNISAGNEDLAKKSKEAYGYAPGDRLYQFPAAAVQSGWLSDLAVYVVEGELDTKGLADGSKVVAIEYPDAEMERFESLWYTIIGRSGDVKSISNTDVMEKVRTTTAENLLLFAFIAALVLLTGCIGMANAYQFSVHRNRHNLQILRAVGMGRRAVAFAHIREKFLWPLIAVVTAIVPIGVFDLVRRYAYYYAFDLGHNFFETAENGRVVQCWQVRFPWYIEVWKQPIWAVMLIGFLFIAGINIMSGVIPVRRMQRQSSVLQSQGR